jgi:quercetin dioxygenase-like cupin family protein
MKVSYTCLYSDSDGESHFKDMEIELQETDFAPPALPMNVSSFTPANEVGFIAAPPGWYGEWHPAPQRQFMFLLAGQIEVGVSDGEVRTYGPGDIALLEDTSGRGHVTRVVGSDDILIAVVRLPG